MIHAIELRAVAVSCAAAAGAATRVAAAPRAAAGACPAPAAGSSASAFVAPQDRANKDVELQRERRRGVSHGVRVCGAKASGASAAKLSNETSWSSV